MAEDCLKRLTLVKNEKYQPDGLKSYGRALVKFDIEPTKDGQFFYTTKPPMFHKLRLLTQKLGFKPQGGQKILMKRNTTLVSDLKHGENVATYNGSESDVAKAAEVEAEDIQNDVEYLCPVGIGHATQTLMLHLDTGFSNIWVWSTELGRGTIKRHGAPHRLFDPNTSHSFKEKHGGTWQISYGDKSSASGTVGIDDVSLGGLLILDQEILLAEHLSKQFLLCQGDGVLGLACGAINATKPTKAATLVETMVSQVTIPKRNELFTAHLGSWKSKGDESEGSPFYTFGYIDLEVLKASGLHNSKDIWYTPVDISDGFWQFSSNAIRIHETSIELESNTAIADTGTSLMLVSDETCEAIYNAIPHAQYDPNVQGWVFPGNLHDDELPLVEFDVGGRFFSVEKENMAFAKVYGEWVYGGIQSRGNLGIDVFGVTFLKGIYAIFDQGYRRFGAVQRLDTAGE